MAEAKAHSRGRVKVYNEAAYDMLCGGRDDEALSERAGGQSTLSPSRGPGASLELPSGSLEDAQRSVQLMQASMKVRQRRDLEDKKHRRFQAFWTQQSEREREAERAVRERIAVTAARREQNFQNMHERLMEGHKLAEELENMLHLHDEAARQRQKQTFDNWTENVFNKIGDNIVEQLNSQQYHEMNARKRREYQKFLDATNAKGAIFRDIIIESEYDPLEANRNAIRAKVPTLDDPTSRVVAKQKEEADIARGEQAVESEHRLGRETLDVLMWGTGKIESTPHGHFAKMLSDNHAPAGAGATGLASRRSNVTFDHYNVARGSAVVDNEFPLGKRTNFAAATKKTGLGGLDYPSSENQSSQSQSQSSQHQ